MHQKTKIYVIFTSTGLDHRGSWDAADIEKKVIKNEEILSELEKRCEGVEFVGKVNIIDEEEKELISRSHYGMTEEERKCISEIHEKSIRRYESAIKNVRRLRENLDGILIFGPPSYELISIGLPIIAVFPLWGRWMGDIFEFSDKGKKILTSCLPVVRDKDRRVFSSRLEDIAEKIRLIQAVSKMKGLRVLVVTDRPVLGEYEPTPRQTGSDREGYEKVYLNNLEEVFGVKLLPIPQEELFEETNKTEEREARKVAEKWINEAEGMKDTNEAEVLKSAKLYLAMKRLMKKYGCDAITTEGYGVFASYHKGPIPSQGLPSSQFCTDGIVATSETLIDSLITQQLGLYVTGRLGFNGDYIIDPHNDIAIIGHCECPFNPYGDERRCPYIIRNLPRWKKNEGGACVQVNLPIGEIVTVVRISVHDKKISLFTGKTVSGKEFFDDWDDLACRTKIAIKTNTKALIKNLDSKTFGAHRVVFYGDFREKIKDLATLIRFEVIEEDI